ncbi:type II toxin-antitoxin system MqsR family toxin [Xanthomonas populi]|uniref:Type II toxin-antitoxin system MqsR family toxin n=1 Tax=Xanthomonas populi TaxID=53414 RepID=A0A2S7EP96_9XANT|nr:type II toxin-antitoxin system MqsR family toxin [Xanthomonas populi]PPU94050.1 hypothetical protein XpopCFBP1817_10345 [Xanthomonas populi]
MATKRLPKGVTRRADGVLEKLTPHFDAGQMKAMVAQHGDRCFTLSSRQGYQAMRLSEQEAEAAILAMDPTACFYKSMTSMANETLWQDVYHVPTPKGAAYVKVQLYLPPDGGEPKAVISFKAK